VGRRYIRYLRYAVQGSVVFFLLYAGYRFSLFVDYYSSAAGAGPAPVDRPPSVEGFLPIGALMSLKLWVTEGIFDRIHPAGLVIFIAAVFTALILKKGFCGWICPVGTFSDLAGGIGKKIFGRNFRLPSLVDYPLRAMKYLLLLFFFFAVVVKMPSFVILQFLEGDYYKIADVKLLYFFTDMSTTTAVALGALVALSVFFRNFWRRYLCPYGALLGLASTCSPLKISRNEDACIHCSRCTRACPSGIPVEFKRRVASPECTGCLTCVSNCPAPGAIDMRAGGRRIHPLVFVALLVLLFFGSIGVGKLAGKWNSSVGPEEYHRIIPCVSLLRHP